MGMLRTLRSTLNACAEPAGREILTSSVIGNFVGAYQPDKLLTNLGGHGVAAVFEGREPGATVLIRSELDGLAFEEGRAPAGVSIANTSHRCGHDGHMTIAAGLAPMFGNGQLAKGRVVLLFQPAEETGYGALGILDDPHFPTIQPDYALALHNLPGYPRNTVILRRGTFACASVGISVKLHGLPSHAAEPEKARTPRRALARLFTELPELSTRRGESPYRLITVTHARMGRESYGITPGNAHLCATLRSDKSAELDRLADEVEDRVRAAAVEDELDVEIEWLDRFAATENDDQLVELLHGSCQVHGVECIEVEQPFRWSDDFGYYGRVCPSLYFGIGIGEEAPRLHQPDYAFADEILESGVSLFSTMARKLAAGDPPRS